MPFITILMTFTGVVGCSQYPETHSYEQKQLLKDYCRFPIFYSKYLSMVTEWQTYGDMVTLTEWDDTDRNLT